MQYLIDNTSRLSLILSAYDADFQIPNNPGQTPAFGLIGCADLIPGSVTAATPFGLGEVRVHAPGRKPERAERFRRARLPEKRGQPEFPAVDLHPQQLHPLSRPDSVGDPIFNGVASRDDRYTLTGGAQLDASYQLTDSHTLRAGYELLFQHASNRTVTDVFPTDANGAQLTNVPEALKA